MNTFFKYAVIGAGTYGLKLAITFLMTDVLRVWYLYSYIVALIVVIAVNFLFNIFYIFKVPDRGADRLIKYLFTLLVFYLLDLISVKALTDFLSVYYLVSITITTVFIFIFKFFIYKYFVFNQKYNTTLK